MAKPKPWNSSTPCWRRLKPVGVPAVRSIRLPNHRQPPTAFNDLSGEIPAELGSLSNLIQLLLRYTNLSGEIPVELGSLSNLGSLELSFTDLSGEIPPELGSLSNLTQLYLHGSHLSGCVPSSWEDQLNLDFSQLGGLPFC